ncbi:glycosyltransferase family 4 protein [Aliiglaciecola sp.]|nr:glycosyltransferase family 4 protein [Aliiglaciecola sp.]
MPIKSIPDENSNGKSIAVIGNYLPRLCGIATFTTDVVESLNEQTAVKTCWAVAINDRADGYDYPDDVRFEISQKRIEDYRLAAEFININQPDIVCLEHEYGIFGGSEGSYILNLLADLTIPVVTTMHTVLANPSEQQQIVTKRLVEYSDQIIVMSNKAVDLLEAVYAVDRSKIAYIPHGIPDVPFLDPNYFKDKFGVAGKKVLLTFGLLSQNKGIEYAIKALPSVVKKHPELVYIVLGATHPNVIASDGDAYRLYLQQLVLSLKLEKHVLFHNRFVSIEELCEYLTAADVYITPYCNEDQICSGTLAYAMGAGKPVISTAYWYAQELLGQGRGVLVPFKESEAIQEALLQLLGDDNKRHDIRKRAYDFSRNATWNNVAQSYLSLFDKVNQNRSTHPKPYRTVLKSLEHSIFNQELPDINLNHMLAMTDDTGLLQHAKYVVPDRTHGYCVDDNARALIVIAEALPHYTDNSDELLTYFDRYLSFLLHAFNPELGYFRNFMSYQRVWLDQKGTEDSHGRAIWGLGVAINKLKDHRRIPLMSNLFRHALPVCNDFTYPRAIAYCLLGMAHYLKSFAGDSETKRVAEALAEKLYRGFKNSASANWIWPERTLTYANATLPHALILIGEELERNEIKDMGLSALEWLMDVQTESEHFSAIGNQQWFEKGKQKSRFDQQPIEAQASVDACAAAYMVTRDEKWLNKAFNAFSWFLGRNDLNLPLYDAKSGGCFDGLHSSSVNQNQGAESTLSWLLSLTRLYSLSSEKSLLNLQKQSLLSSGSSK